MQVERHSPALSLRLFESEHQDGQGFHREAPSHAKSVRFPEQVNISPANDDRGQLEGDNEIDEAIRSSVLGGAALETNQAVRRLLPRRSARRSSQ